jgi:single-strand DNA-binding protein
MLEGRLGRDAEIKTTARGNKYVSFTLAVDSKDKNGEKTTNWYNVSSFQENHVGKFAEYLKKGNGLIVMGTPSYGIWIDKNGQPKLDLNVRASNLEFPTLTGNKEGGQQQTGDNEPVVRTTATQASYTPTAEPEDDLPF